MTRYLWMTAAAGLFVAGCGGRTELLQGKNDAEFCGNVGETCVTSAACCGGGSCLGGVCVAPICAAGDAPVVLVSGSERLSGLLADGEHVYYTHYGSGGAVLRVHKSGGAAETLVPSSVWTESLVADEGSIYFMDGDRIARASKDSGVTSLLATEQDGSMSIAVDEAFVYWIDPADRAVRRVAKAGGPVDDIAKDEELTSEMVPRLIADATTLYWSASGLWSIPGLHATPKVGGGGITTIEAAATTHFVADATYLFYIDEGSDFEGDPTSELWRVRKDGTERTKLAEWPFVYGELASGMAQDDTHVFWANGQARSMMRGPKAGGDAVELFVASDAINVFTVDASCVYYVTNRISNETGELTSSLLRAPRYFLGE